MLEAHAIIVIPADQTDLNLVNGDLDRGRGSSRLSRAVSNSLNQEMGMARLH